MGKRNVLLASDVDDVAALMREWRRAWVSEKLDGFRALLADRLTSSYGNPFAAPAFWLADVLAFRDRVRDIVGRAVTLDGELWAGRGKMQALASIASQKTPHDGWREVTFRVFDVVGLPPADAHAVLSQAGDGDCAAAVPQVEVDSAAAIDDMMRDVVAGGGEGLMLRHPACVWEPRRSTLLRKLKPCKDAEAIVIGYTMGNGRLAGMLGSLAVRLGHTEFSLSGFADGDRIDYEATFPIGSTVTFRYTSLTSDGVPREARFWRKLEHVY